MSFHLTAQKYCTGIICDTKASFINQIAKDFRWAKVLQRNKMLLTGIPRDKPVLDEKKKEKQKLFQRSFSVPTLSVAIDCKASTLRNRRFFYTVTERKNQIALTSVKAQFSITSNTALHSLPHLIFKTIQSANSISNHFITVFKLAKQLFEVSSCTYGLRISTLLYQYLRSNNSWRVGLQICQKQSKSILNFKVSTN